MLNFWNEAEQMDCIITPPLPILKNYFTRSITQKLPQQRKKKQEYISFHTTFDLKVCQTGMQRQMTTIYCIQHLCAP
jgi:hypothetical protein